MKLWPTGPAMTQIAMNRLGTYYQDCEMIIKFNCVWNQNVEDFHFIWPVHK